MAFLQLQNAKLEQSESMNSEHSMESTRSSSYNILDQIKRSAGSTPAKNRLVRQDFAVTIEKSDTSKGCAGFTTNLTASTSQSSSDEIPTTFSLFQTSSSRTRDDSREEETQKLNFHHDDHRDDYDDSWTHLPFGAVNSMDQIESKRRQHMQQQQQHVKRTFRLGNPSQIIAASANETTIFSPLHSVGSQNSTDTSWEEDGDVASVSLLDNADDDEEDHTIFGETDDENLDDDDDSDDESNGVGSPINAVESFLDELADVDGVQKLGTLLFQVGSCTLPGSNVDVEDDDFTATSGMFPRMGALQQKPRGPPQRGRSISPRSLPTVSNSFSLLDDPADSFSQIFQNLSLKADSLLEILGSHSTNNDDGATTSSSSQRSFFDAMFSCNG